MSRISVLGALVVAGSVTIAVSAAQQPPPAPAVDLITAEKVKDNLWVLRVTGVTTGNTAVFVTAKGVTVVDTKNPGWGQPLIDKIKTLTDKPITTVINTHTHYDHVSGNVAMPGSVEIIAHEYTAKRLPLTSSVAGIGNTPNVFKDNPGKGLVTKSFKDKLTIGSGADRINLYYFGRAHTSGDAFVEFAALRVMHVGDTFFNKGLPIMDANNGGSAVEFANTVEKALKGVPNVDSIINGHTAAQTTPADMREFITFVREFVSTVQAGKKAGKTVDQVAKEWATPAKYKDYIPAPSFDRVRADVQLVFDETK